MDETLSTLKYIFVHMLQKGQGYFFTKYSVFVNFTKIMLFSVNFSLPDI